MQITTSTEIAQPKEAVWRAITDIENTGEMISSILSIDVLEKPASGVVGLKWQETRKMFGKEATETMWITEAVDNEYYCTRAESHGSVYLSYIAIADVGDKTRLTMTFSAQPQTAAAKILSFLMAPMIKGSIKKELQKDLEDIKAHLEGKYKDG